MQGNMSFEFQFGKPQAAQLQDDMPLHMLLLADFSAHGSKSPLAERAFMKVDIDNLDQVIARYAPRLELDLAGTKIHLAFRELDDFLPDHLYRNVPLFGALRAQLAKDMAPASVAPAAAPAPAAEDANPFQSLLGGSIGAKPVAANTSANAGSSTGGSAFDNMIKQMVTPHLTPAISHTNAEQTALQDAACGLLMRAILHHPEFQALESAWRGVHFLVTQLELDHPLQLMLVDVSKAELAQDLASHGENLAHAASFHLLAERWQRAADAVPWSLLIGQYEFDASGEDVQTLAAIGAIAKHLNAPFIASGHSSIIGCPQVAEHPEPRLWPEVDSGQAARWQALCQSSQAPWLGLTAPRLLMRLPYGANTDRVDGFPFEEMANFPVHQQFLWGHGALIGGVLLAAEFQEEGWDMQAAAAGSAADVADLPAYTWRNQGEAVLQPCAEACLLERAAEVFLGHGLMPLQSYKNRNAVRLLRLQSLGKTALAGRWQQGA